VATLKGEKEDGRTSGDGGQCSNLFVSRLQVVVKVLVQDEDQQTDSDQGPAVLLHDAPACGGHGSAGVRSKAKRRGWGPGCTKAGSGIKG